MCEGTAIKYDTPVAHRLCMRGAALCVYYCCVVFALPADYCVCRHYSCRQLYCLSDYSSARRSTLGTVRVLTTVTPDAQLRRKRRFFLSKRPQQRNRQLRRAFRTSETRPTPSLQYSILQLKHLHRTLHYCTKKHVRPCTVSHRIKGLGQISQV